MGTPGTQPWTGSWGGVPKKLLLLTATPVNNSLWDLHNLFLLFGRHDGAFGDDPLRIPSLRRFFA